MPGPKNPNDVLRKRRLHAKKLQMRALLQEKKAELAKAAKSDAKS